MTFLRNFNEAFKKSGLSQTQLANQTKIPKANIHDYLKGKYRPKYQRIIILAKALKVDPTWLAGEDKVKHELKNMPNLYLDNKKITKDELNKVIDYLRLLRLMEKD